jgi:hypothetical protein
MSRSGIHFQREITPTASRPPPIKNSDAKNSVDTPQVFCKVHKKYGNYGKYIPLSPGYLLPPQPEVSYAEFRQSFRMYRVQNLHVHLPQ